MSPNETIFLIILIGSSLLFYGFVNTCIKIPTNCQNTKYRSFDGSCNNLKHPEWGMSYTRYGRLRPAKYGDGIHSIATAKSGRPLPGPRKVSLELFPDVPIEDKFFTLNAMQYGQIITHDMSLNILDSTRSPCCSQNGQNLNPSELPRQCDPIQISKDDPDFSKDNKTCMPFVRTVTDKDRNCSEENQPAEQLSEVTHYLDLSLVYGYLNNITDYTREYSGGRLRVDIRNGYQWPIPSINRPRDCPASSANDLCYFTSDPRINQNTQLTILQIIFLREHNLIADKLAKLNPHWSDETVFQEARKITIGEYQYISYYEWMPTMLGKERLYVNKIIYKTDGYVNDYNDCVDPSVLNEHSHAAFRFSHSQIAGRLDLMRENRKCYGSIGFSDWNFRPIILEMGSNFDGLARGLTTQHEMASDVYHDKEITSRLFRFGGDTGVDLKSLDIARGRDHGLPSYNEIREYCGLRKANRFMDFSVDIKEIKYIEKLSKLYESPDDVDLIIGGSLETPLPGTLVGPTFYCILLEQFRRTRNSDRFWFENSGETGFTLAQLKEIRKASISRLLCDNGNNIKTMQPRGFEIISYSNPVLPCEFLPTINLELWKEV